MRFQLIALLCIFSFSLHASDDKAMNELFEKYDKVMGQHKVELVDEVFSKKFLTENGGKEEFIAKVKELPKVKEKKGLGKLLRKWKRSKVGKIFFANVKDEETKAGTPSHESQFIVIEEEGKLKIDGTISDGN
jgi:hypothetical protein